MSRGERVTVYRGGFLSSLVYGVCGVIGVAIVSAVGVGVYGMNMVDRTFNDVLAAGSGLWGSLPEIRESLPPIMSDVLDDRRAPEYREHLKVAATVVPSQDTEGEATIVVEAINSGSEMITLLAVRVNLEDRTGQLVRSETAYIATPFAVEGEWAGPILPGSTRQHAIRLWRCPPDLVPQVEICDIRVWTKQAAEAVSQP